MDLEPVDSCPRPGKNAEVRTTLGSRVRPSRAAEVPIPSRSCLDRMPSLIVSWIHPVVYLDAPLSRSGQTALPAVVARTPHLSARASMSTKPNPDSSRAAGVRGSVAAGPHRGPPSAARCNRLPNPAPARGQDAAWGEVPGYPPVRPVVQRGEAGWVLVNMACNPVDLLVAGAGPTGAGQGGRLKGGRYRARNLAGRDSTVSATFHLGHGDGRRSCAGQQPAGQTWDTPSASAVGQKGRCLRGIYVEPSAVKAVPRGGGRPAGTAVTRRRAGRRGVSAGTRRRGRG
jgi:hypothetical protein